MSSHSQNFNRHAWTSVWLGLAGVLLLPGLASSLALWIAVPLRQDSRDPRVIRLASLAIGLGILGLLEAVLLAGLLIY